MLWVPRVGEIPLAVANLEDREMMLIIAKKGKVTSYLHERIGELKYLHIRGPYGHGYSYSGIKKAMIVGGGYGVASLLYLARKMYEDGVDVVALLGFKKKEDIILLDYFQKYVSKIYVATDDGSYGFKGTVLDILKEKILRLNPEKVYVCGPELMEYNILKFLHSKSIPAEFSLERLIKCAIGICGSCVLQPLGLLVCKDGPVFPIDILVKVRDFGKKRHTFSGKEVSINEK